MIAICPNCKGNGFIKMKDEEDGEMTIHQCWKCISTGENKHEDTDSYWNYTPAE
jgi:Zn ribbon nucleic-acid-binding protein